MSDRETQDQLDASRSKVKRLTKDVADLKQQVRQFEERLRKVQSVAETAVSVLVEKGFL